MLNKLKTLNLLQFLKDLKVIAKLYLGFCMLLVVLVIVAIYSIVVQRDLAASSQQIYQESLLTNQALLSLSVDFQDLNATVSSALLENPSDAMSFIEVINNKTDLIEGQFANIQQSFGEKEFGTFEMMWQNYKNDLTSVTEYLGMNNAVVGNITAMDAATSVYTSQMKNKVDGLSKILTDKTSSNSSEAEQSYVATTEKNESSIFWMFVLTIIAMIVTLGVGKIVADSIVKPLKTMLGVADAMAQGKLNQSIEVSRKDELGLLSASFNHLSKQMQGIIHNVRDMASKVQHSMEELSQGSEQTATSATTITESVQLIADRSEKQKLLATANGEAVEDLTGNIHHVTSISSQVLEASQGATDNASQGNQSIQTAVEQMNVIKTTMNENMNVVTELNERMKQIDKMAKIISDISSQTNLLSLNASIEAARAGEHGKGFAVVADEVKKLSEISGESSKQITQLLSLIEKDTKYAIEVTTRGNDEVIKGVDYVNDAGQSFQSIVEQMTHVTSENKHLNQLAKTMSESTEKMLASIHDIIDLSKESAESTSNAAAATEEQVASVEEFVALVHSVNEQSKELLESLEIFEIGESQEEPSQA